MPDESGQTHDAPIFVVGFHRSGTTLLQALIGAHPRIAAPPELGFYARVFARRHEWGDLHDDAALRAVIAAALDRETLAEAGFDADRVYARAVGGPRTYAGVLTAIMADFADQHGKPRWCEKTPLQPAEWIWAQLPDAQLVHIVRDPRDSIASHAALPWDVPDPVTLARKWRDFTRATIHAGAQRGPSSYLRIRYEDLAREPAPVLTQVFTFLGEQFDPGVLTDVDRRRATVMPVANDWLGRVLEPIAPPDEGAWRDKLARDVRVRIAPIVASLAAGLGYESAAPRAVAAGRAVNAVLSPARFVPSWARMRRQKRS